MVRSQFEKGLFKAETAATHRRGDARENWHGIRVMLAIGGITYVSAWNQALAENATQLGLNAAAVANSLGVGIEIDYEESSAPDTTHLQSSTRSFVQGVEPNCAGVTPGMFGYMFWAAERPSSPGIGTVPPNSCEKGAGAGATALNIQIPMPPSAEQQPLSNCSFIAHRFGSLRCRPLFPQSEPRMLVGRLALQVGRYAPPS